MLQVRIGAYTVTRIEEMLTPGFDPAFLFPDFDPAVYDEDPQLAGPAFRDAGTGRLMSSMQSWLVHDGHNVVVIDTGCGNGKTRDFPAFNRFHNLDQPYLERLADAGVRPEDVTVVINTHLHVDHVGWNTRWLDERWTPTFPGARYALGAEELDRVLSPRKTGNSEGIAAEIQDSVLPLLESGLVDPVQAGDSLFADLSFEAIPGHTMGQLAVRLRSGGDSALFCGDVFHQPMQMVRPGWNSRFCENQDVARVTRARVLEAEADRGTIFFPSHFGVPHAGAVRRTEAGFRFVPLEPAA